MTELALVFALGVLGLGFVAFLARWTLARAGGEGEMVRVAALVRAAADAFQKRQASTIAAVSAAFGGAIFLAYGLLRRAGDADPVPALELGVWLTISFAIGAALALAVSAFGSDARADDSDAWLAPDKSTHFVVAGTIAGVGYGLTSIASDSVAFKIAMGSGLAIAAGAGKEIWDATGRGDPSWKDFTWDCLGAAAGIGVALVIDFATRAPRVRSSAAR